MFEMRKYLGIGVLILLGGCYGTEDVCPDKHTEDGLIATVVGVEDCNLLLLEFNDEDVDAVAKITGVESSRYFALNLTKVLLYPGQELLVNIRKMTDDEGFPCPTFAPTYPGLYVTSYQVIR